jgi:hypothetical protein
MKIELYKQSGQFLIIPTIKITYDRLLNGYYEIIFVWGKWGITFMF